MRWSNDGIADVGSYSFIPDSLPNLERLHLESSTPLFETEQRYAKLRLLHLSISNNMYEEIVQYAIKVVNQHWCPQLRKMALSCLAARSAALDRAIQDAAGALDSNHAVMDEYVADSDDCDGGFGPRVRMYRVTFPIGVTSSLKSYA
jgi:hypothetical protein